ncbi:MAG: GNAT family N-acetyltransferase [Brevefilum sp.]|jgi:GNAT superfamily N-acetyltransferase
MELKVRQIKDKNEKETIARSILNNLLEWFSLPESTLNYIQESKEMPFLACFDGKKSVGFIALNATSKDCADIFVMGVLKEYHRKGAGTKLYKAYEQLAKGLGYTYSQVKTVQSGHYEAYDVTNQFYIAMGYKELECFPKLWDEWNPCQIYVKYIGNE